MDKSKESLFNETIYISKDLFWIQIPYEQEDKNNPYIIVLMHTDTLNRKMVRVYLKEAKYADGKFTKDELETFLRIVNGNLFTDNMQNNKSEFIELSNIKGVSKIKTMWKYILVYWDYLNPKYIIDVNTPIPDYSKLEVLDEDFIPYKENNNEILFYITDKYAFRFVMSDKMDEPYFIVTTISTSKRRDIKLSINNPKYIGDEKFTKDELNEVIEILNTYIMPPFNPEQVFDENRNLNYISTFRVTIWEHIVYSLDKCFPMCGIDIFDSMPNYSILETI